MLIIHAMVTRATLTWSLDGHSIFGMDTHGLVAPDALARRIRMIMGDKKVTRKWLAQQTNISRPSIASKLDARVAFTYDELLRVIDALGVAWEELFTDTGDDFAASARSSDSPIRLRDFSARKDRSL